jgi:hypothetical protein
MVVFKLHEVENEVFNFQVRVVNIEDAVARIVVVVGSNRWCYELNNWDVWNDCACRSKDVDVMDVRAYWKKVILLIRLYYTDECIDVLLPPQLLQLTLVVVVAWEYMSLRNKLFPYILIQHTGQPLKHKLRSVLLLNLVWVERVNTVYGD